MRWLAPLSLLALSTACGPATASLIDPTELDEDDAPQDTAVEADTDTDSDTDVDTDTDTDSDVDTDTEPPGPLTWTGTRDYVFYNWQGDETCQDTLPETGVEVTDDPDYADAVASCATCDHVFLITVTPDVLCDGQLQWGGIPVTSPAYRGLWFLGGDDANVVDIRRGRGGSYSAETLAEGTFSAPLLEYAYERDPTGYSYDVEATATIE